VPLILEHLVPFPPNLPDWENLADYKTILSPVSKGSLTFKFLVLSEAEAYISQSYILHYFFEKRSLKLEKRS